MRKFITMKFIILCVILSNVNCFRGTPSEKPPVHLIKDMDYQEKYDAQEEGKFFNDGSAMRTPVEGTVPRGSLNDNEYFTGLDDNGRFLNKAPVKITLDLLKRGQERFNIYCSACHSGIGDGNGIVVKRGFKNPPSYHTDSLRTKPDGHFFNVISKGFNNMPSLAHQIQISDRWSIIAYLRVLQRSQNAKLEDIPQEKREKIK